MTIEDIRNNFISNLDGKYTPAQIKDIDNGLYRMKREYGLLEIDLGFYCTADPNEMFACIFDGKEFDPANFETEE